MIATECRAVNTRDRLRWLARAWDGFGPAVRELLLFAWTSDDLPQPEGLQCSCGSKCECGTCVLCVWGLYRQWLAKLDAEKDAMAGASSLIAQSRVSILEGLLIDGPQAGAA